MKFNEWRKLPEVVAFYDGLNASQPMGEILKRVQEYCYEEGQKWSNKVNTPGDDEGLKNDEDVYDKVDYSLIPLDIIVKYVQLKTSCNLSESSTYEDKNFTFFSWIHDIVNGHARKAEVSVLLNDVIKLYGIKPLASSLGFGLSKYNERDNWKKFSTDPDRFLKAAMRHLMAIITGGEYDHEEGVEGYNKGNSHRGAVCFALMVADNIIKKGNDCDNT